MVGLQAGSDRADHPDACLHELARSSVCCSTIPMPYLGNERREPLGGTVYGLNLREENVSSIENFAQK